MPRSTVGTPQVSYLGMAWDDDTTLRVALVDLLLQPTIDEGEIVRSDALIVERYPTTSHAT